MDYRTLKISDSDYKSIYGNEVYSFFFFFRSGGKDNSLLLYIDGIKEFDDILRPLKHANTDLYLSIEVMDKGLTFMLFGKDISQHISYFKDELESIVVYRDQEIDIPDVNRILNIMKTGMVGEGVAGSVIASAIGHAGSSLIKKFKQTQTKKSQGNIYELRFNTKSGEKHTIRICCEYEWGRQINKLFDELFSSNLSKDDPKERCFITTVCYEDPNSLQVQSFINFRDQNLNRFYLGTVFIRFYYKVSPKLSSFIYQKPFIKKTIKQVILDPIYYLIK